MTKLLLEDNFTLLSSKNFYFTCDPESPFLGSDPIKILTNVHEEIRTIMSFEELFVILETTKYPSNSEC